MDRTKLKFIFVMGLAGASVIVMALANKGFQITIEAIIVIGLAAAGIFLLVLFLKKYNSIWFLRNMKEKPKELVDDATRRLCGFKTFTAYNDFIIFESESGKLTGHSYILLERLPFMIEELTESQQIHITSSFSRLLGTFNHPFTYMPICKPVQRTRFIKELKDKIYNLRIARSVAKVPDPQQQIEEKVLEKQLNRLTQGESPIEVIFVVQLREPGKNMEEIKGKLDVDSKSMIANLDVIHQVNARKLRGVEMIDAVRDFFMLEV
ncbi:MAG: hypothetical protein HY295_00240 [Thaumarchaeota archaeon]|nr:hypothetical protein [Nitrososphaerota archaeon]